MRKALNVKFKVAKKIKKISVPKLRRVPDTGSGLLKDSAEKPLSAIGGGVVEGGQWVLGS